MGDSLQLSVTILLLGILILQVSGQSNECRYGWIVQGESCYLFASQPATWAEAEEYCMSFGSYLVEINSKDESDFLETYLKNLTSQHNPGPKAPQAYWIGGDDIEMEGRYRWSSSDLPLTYTDWGPGQPDDYNKNEDCLELRGEFSFHWNDMWCFERQHFLCEMPTFNDGELIIG